MLSCSVRIKPGPQVRRAVTVLLPAQPSRIGGLNPLLEIFDKELSREQL